MSLVIARTIGASACIVADTHLTPYNAEPKTLEGSLKCVILSKECAVAYAGDKDPACEALRQFDSTHSAEEISDHFFRFHQSSGSRTDFILGFGKPSPRFIMIKTNQIEQTNACWLGDLVAFEQYQAVYHSENLPPTHGCSEGRSIFQVQRIPEGEGIDQEAFGRMNDAFQRVIDSNVSPGVGGFVVPVAYELGVWKYFDYTRLFSHLIDWRMVFGERPGEWVPVPFGDAESGGYAANFMGANSRKPSGAALYFPQGQFGIVYDCRTGEPRRNLISGPIGPLDFEDLCWLKFGLAVRTMHSGADEYGRRGWRRFLAGDVSGASADVTKALELEPNHFMGRFASGLIAESQGCYSEATAQLRAAIAINPCHARAQNALGIIYARQREFKLAIAAFENAAAIDPSLQEAVDNLQRARKDLIEKPDTPRP